MISLEIYMDIKSLRKKGLSIRKIARRLGVDRRTVKRYLESEKFPEYTREKRSSVLEPYYKNIEQYLEEDDYSATWIFDRLQKLGYDGSYSTVRNYVRTIKEKKSKLAYVRFETEPGLQAQVDWGCFDVVQKDGSIKKYYAFFMILGYSRTLYVEIVKNCKLEVLMDCHTRAFKYLRGVPHEVLYDNMKTVVEINGKEKKINQEFLHFANHYSFQPKLCPVYSPWVKGKVERPVSYVRERFWRGYNFVSIDQANQDMVSWLNTTANVRIHGTHQKKISDRWQKEMPELHPLPANDYDTSVKVVRKVYKDCQVSYGGNRYVVPYKAVGKKILLKVKNGVIRFYDDNQLLVSYQESEGSGETIQYPRFYEQLQRDQQQNRRKYKKGKAFCESKHMAVEVNLRPIQEYDLLIQGED